MTISKDECFYLGYISKTQGYKGGLIVFFDVDDIYEYRKLDRILVELHGVLTPFFIENVVLKDKNFVFLKIEGINDEDAATELAGNNLYLPLSYLPELPDDAYYLHDLEGMKVNDKKAGMVGMVNQVLDYSANPLLQIVEGDDEILIPIIEAFIVRVDKKEKIIYTDVPEGLIEINKS